MADEIKGIGLGLGSSQSLLQQIKLQKGIPLEGVTKDASPKEVEKAGKDFEALLLKQMFAEMWKTAPSAGGLSGSQEEGQYRDMFNDALANEISAGQGIGIKEVFVRELSRKQKKQ